MYQTQPSMTNKPRDDGSVLERPRTVLLDEIHWLYVARRYHLSPRELQVAKLVCCGFNNEEIAHSLKIKNGTVKTHLRNIYRRIRVTSKISMLLKFIGDAIKFSASADTPASVLLTRRSKPKKATI